MLWNLAVFFFFLLLFTFCFHPLVMSQSQNELLPIWAAAHSTNWWPIKNTMPFFHLLCVWPDKHWEWLEEKRPLGTNKANVIERKTTQIKCVCVCVQKRERKRVRAKIRGERWVTGVSAKIELNDFVQMWASVWIHKYIDCKFRLSTVFVGHWIAVISLLSIFYHRHQMFVLSVCFQYFLPFFRCVVLYCVLGSFQRAKCVHICYTFYFGVRTIEANIYMLDTK